MKYTDSIAVHSADVGAPFTAKGTRGGETSSGMGGICQGTKEEQGRPLPGGGVCWEAQV